VQDEALPLIAIESHLTIPDALVTWALDPERQMHWPRAYGNDIQEILERAKSAHLSSDDLERLLSRLEAVVTAAKDDGQENLFVGFDLQTAEWLGLEFHVETPRGPMHIGPDPATQHRPDMPEPQWSFREVRVLFDAGEKEALDLAWAAKRLLFKVFPNARITSLEHDLPVRFCIACGEVAGDVMVETTDGFEYHSKCWSRATSSGPRAEAKVPTKVRR
jgi:hypothetical protein